MIDEITLFDSLKGQKMKKTNYNKKIPSNIRLRDH